MNENELKILDIKLEEFVKKLGQLQTQHTNKLVEVEETVEKTKAEQTEFRQVLSKYSNKIEENINKKIATSLTNEKIEELATAIMTKRYNYFRLAINKEIEEKMIKKPLRKMVLIYILSLFVLLPLTAYTTKYIVLNNTELTERARLNALETVRSKYKKLQDKLDKCEGK